MTRFEASGRAWFFFCFMAAAAACGRSGEEKASTANARPAPQPATKAAAPDHTMKLNAIVRRDGEVDECIELAVETYKTVPDAVFSPPDFGGGLPEGAEPIDEPCASAIATKVVASCVVDHESEADGLRKHFQARSHYYRAETALGQPSYRGNCDLMKGRWEVAAH